MGSDVSTQRPPLHDATPPPPAPPPADATPGEPAPEAPPVGRLAPNPLEAPSDADTDAASMSPLADAAPDPFAPDPFAPKPFLPAAHGHPSPLSPARRRSSAADRRGSALDSASRRPWQSSPLRRNPLADGPDPGASHPPPREEVHPSADSSGPTRRPRAERSTSSGTSSGSGTCTASPVEPPPAVPGTVVDDEADPGASLVEPLAPPPPDLLGSRRPCPNPLLPLAGPGDDSDGDSDDSDTSMPPPVGAQGSSQSGSMSPVSSVGVLSPQRVVAPVLSSDAFPLARLQDALFQQDSAAPPSTAPDDGSVEYDEVHAVSEGYNGDLTESDVLTEPPLSPTVAPLPPSGRRTTVRFLKELDYGDTSGCYSSPELSIAPSGDATG